MEKKTVAIIAIVCGVAIFGIKILAYFLSNSVALLSDALESIVNIAASGLMLFSVCVSERAPDSDHKYGHQKIEDISTAQEEANKIFERFKKGEKLSTEDLMILQKAGLL